MFATYAFSSSDHILSADVIFVSLSLLNILRFPMTLVPLLIVYLVQVKTALRNERQNLNTFLKASVSFTRLNKFMNCDELQQDAVEESQNSKGKMKICFLFYLYSLNTEDAVTITNGSFKWDTEVTLSDINLKIKKGSLVGVVGAVGTGKSSLCSAILGEMNKTSGSVVSQVWFLCSKRK